MGSGADFRSMLYVRYRKSLILELPFTNYLLCWGIRPINRDIYRQNDATLILQAASFSRPFWL
jgi:hypothetical protein